MPTFRTEGGLVAYAARLHALHTPPTRPHRPAALPPPDGAHFAQLAAEKRREALGIERHLRADDTSPAALFARRQARELREQADAYDALSQGGASLGALEEGR